MSSTIGSQSCRDRICNAHQNEPIAIYTIQYQGNALGFNIMRYNNIIHKESSQDTNGSAKHISPLGSLTPGFFCSTRIKFSQNILIKAYTQIIANPPSACYKKHMSTINYQS